jgi:hypothetical protein
LIIALHRSKLLMQLHQPFSVRTAERLMAIARNPVLTKSDNLSLLPPSSGDPTGGFREVFVFDAQ